MSIGERIREKRKANHLTLQQVADVFGISRSSVSDWESGKTRPDQAKLRKLADTLHTSVDFLLEAPDGTTLAVQAKNLDPRQTRNTPEAQLKTYVESLRAAGQPVAEPESNHNVTGLGREAIKLPVISWIQAGEWGTPMNNINLESVEEWVVCPFPHSKDSFVLKVTGRSMFNPNGDLSFRDGEYISVDPTREASNGSLVVVLRDGDEAATFRQLLVESDGTRFLCALNAQWHPQYMEMDDDSDRIVGVVTGQWRPLI